MVQFRTAPGPSMLAGGLEMRSTSILRHSPADSYHHRLTGSGSFGTLSLPVEDMASVGETVAGADLTLPRDTISISVAPSVIAKLARLHAAAGYLAERAPEIIANANAARGLEQELSKPSSRASAIRRPAIAAWRKASTQSSCAASTGWWRRIRESRPTSRRFARRSGYRSELCACAVKSIWECRQSVSFCCAACTSRGERCARQRRMRHP
jgi:hypothetical protein